MTWMCARPVCSVQTLLRVVKLGRVFSDSFRNAAFHSKGDCRAARGMMHLGGSSSLSEKVRALQPIRR
jgi:hypothetical protein